jgi:ribosomal protein S18 acetylase RimI-like enzyme
VAGAAWRKGVANTLLDAAKQHRRVNDCRRPMLQTAVTSTTAQKLYERTGWKRDNDYYVHKYRFASDSISCLVSRCWGKSAPLFLRRRESPEEFGSADSFSVWLGV